MLQIHIFPFRNIIHLFSEKKIYFGCEPGSTPFPRLWTCPQLLGFFRRLPLLRLEYTNSKVNIGVNIIKLVELLPHLSTTFHIPIHTSKTSQLATSGKNRQLATSGKGRQLATSGKSRQLATSGKGRQLATSGKGRQLATSGKSGQLATSGLHVS